MSNSTRTRASLRTIATVALAAIQGCASASSASAPGIAPAGTDSIWVREEIHFGSLIPTGGEVSEQQWEAFLDAEVSSRFPEGFTSLDAMGRYRYRTGEIKREPGHIIVFFHPPSAENEAKVVALMEAYKKAFAQESVLRATSRQTVKFYE